MKAKLIFAAIAMCSLLNVSAQSKTFSTADELANEIFELIKSNDKEALLQLVVTREDLAKTFPQEARKDYVQTTQKIIAMLESDSVKNTQEIIAGFDQIRNDFRKCKKSAETRKIAAEEHEFNFTPMRLGEITIEYTCGKNIYAIYAEVLYTANGWRLLEDLKKSYGDDEY